MLLGGDALLGLLGLSAAEAADPRPAPVPEPKLLSPDLLPDLYLGNGGLLLSRSPAGAATCRLMAEVDNRLAANALPGLSQAAIGNSCGFCHESQAASSQQAGSRVRPTAACVPLVCMPWLHSTLGQGCLLHQPSCCLSLHAPPSPGLLPNGALDGSQPAFSVCLTEGGPELDSIEALVAALADAGHRVRLRLTSNLTSFGVGMSVRAGLSTQLRPRRRHQPHLSLPRGRRGQ